MFKKFLAPIPEDELKMVTEKAYLIIESFNLVGYDAMGIGDDDLSLGKEFLLEIAKKANFPLLSSNILDEESGKPFFQPYIIKKLNGMRIGIFSLLSPDNFLSQSDLRRKGLSFQPPIDSAQNMVKELQSKTDLILLLSHLGYPRDVQLAQTVSGINFIMGSHTGINLVYPPVLKNTLIFQMAPRGMYAGRLDLNLYNNESNFFNSMDRRSLENGLNNLKERITLAQVSEIEGWLQHYSPIYSRIYNISRFYNLPISGDLIQTLRDLLTFLKTQEVEKSIVIRVKAKGEIEQFLKLLHRKNEFTHNLFQLSEQIKDHPEIRKIIEAFRTKSLEIEKTVSPRYEAPRTEEMAPPK